jgi:hypothetical protein
MFTATFIDDNLRHNFVGRRQLVLAGAHRLTAMKKKPVVDSGLVLCLTFFSLITESKKEETALE